ncbi:hypothetical protein B566_EDAN004919 [Ephemera danica]|nr:hypothetical protein B566_EDAN004919 [Ephemera danica]
MASNVKDLLSRDNPIFAIYAFYAAVLVVKMFATALYTSLHRVKKGVFINPEDAVTFGSKGMKLINNDQDVERIRRAHLNDLENIPAFLFIALLYILTDPSTFLAMNLIRAFAAARVLHTLVYAVKPMPQPSRALFYFVGLGVTSYMAAIVAMHFGS